MRRILSWFKAQMATPNGIILVTWAIFILFLPFLVISFWGVRSWVEGLRLTGGVLWAFTFSNAYLNRFYYRLFNEQSVQLRMMVETLEIMWHQMHSHCPNCGQQFKAPEVRQ